MYKIRNLIGALHHPGIIRAKYLNNWNSPKALTPGKMYEATIELFPFAHYFKKGHRLGIIIRSEWFPSFDRNLNTGERIKNAANVIVAYQKIFHDYKNRSSLQLWKHPID